MSDADELDIGDLSSAFRACVESSCPDALPLAARLWPRLDPTHWTLEWHLPVWLGDAFRLERAVSSELVLSNVLGLASIRLQDDLADGEVDPREEPNARVLSAALYDAALDVYRRRFGKSSPFWPRLQALMREWRSSGQQSSTAPAGLAQRGAPLKVSAFAACLLAGKLALVAHVDACLDHALAAMVMYDHLCDWPEDLAAGRWNAFVERYGSHPQLPMNASANRASVLAAMLARRAVADQFALIAVELEQAAHFATEVGSRPLAAYLDGLAVRLAREATAREQRYAELGDAAVALVFGNQKRMEGAPTDGRQTLRPAHG